MGPTKHLLPGDLAGQQGGAACAEFRPGPEHAFANRRGIYSGEFLQRKRWVLRPVSNPL